MRSRFLLLAWLGLIWGIVPTVTAQEDPAAGQPPSEPEANTRTTRPAAPADAEDYRENPPSAPDTEAEFASQGESPEPPPLTAEEAVRLGTRSVETIDEASDQEARQKAADDLRRCVTVLMANDPGNPWLYYLRGCVYSYAGQSGDAINELGRFLDTQAGRNHWRAYRIMGDLFVDEFPALAKSYYTKANRLHQNEASVLFGLSRAAKGLGKKEEAIEHAREAVNADPERGITYMVHLVRLLVEDQQLAEAASVATQALDRTEVKRNQNPAEVQQLADLEARYRQLLDITRARIKRSPETGNLYGEVAEYLLELSRVQHDRALLDALTTLDLGIEATAPSTPLNLLQKRAALLVQLGRLEEAREAYERILETYPMNQTALDFLERQEPPTPESQDRLEETNPSRPPNKTEPGDETQPTDGTAPPVTPARPNL
jgi:tetratricopeptide (TPR) repeat protein